MHDIIVRLYSGRVSSYHPYRESTNPLVKHLIGACFWPVFCVPLLHAVVVRECSVGSLCVVLSISMRRSVGRRGWYSSCFTLASFTEEGRSYRIAIFDIVSLLVHSITVKLQIRRELAVSETFRTSCCLVFAMHGQARLACTCACVGGTTDLMALHRTRRSVS